MAYSLLKQLNGSGHGFKIDRHVSFWVPYDLSVTFGTIFDNMRKWIKNDLKGVVEFNHEFVDTQLISDKGYFWTSGILGQGRKPILNLQFSVDHLHEHPAFGAGYNFSNRESINYMDERGPMLRVMAFEDETNAKNNLEIRIAFKNAHINCHAGIVDVSRPKINNIAHFWHTVRKPNEQIYHFSHYVDFKIPTEIMNLIIDRFKVDTTNHHKILKFLNSNSFVNVYYGMSGYDGKFYYFLRYPVKSFIKTEGMNNPEPWAEEGQLTPEVYTLERDFSADVLVPMYLSFSAYGDRVVLEDPKYKIEEKWRGVDFDRAVGSVVERFIEVERVFKDRHLIKEVKFNWNEEDLIKHPSGTVTTKKISLEDFLELDDDKYLQALVNWAKKKGYTYMDLFNFQLYQNPGVGLHNIDARPNPLRNVIETTEEDYATIPADNDEYEYYLKNMEEFFIVDFKPVFDRELYGQIYLSLAIRNEFEYELNNAGVNAFGNDDLGFSTGYGHSKSNEYNPKL